MMPQAISTCLLTGIKNPSVVSSMMVCPIFNEFTYAPPVSFSINYENSDMYYSYAHLYDYVVLYNRGNISEQGLKKYYPLNSSHAEW